MKVIPPLTLLDSMVVTNAPETAPAAYASGTTYTLGQMVSVAGTGNSLAVYQSLANGNIGHAPAGSPTWWQNIGTTYGVYNNGTTYNLNDIVIEVSTNSHQAYQSLQAANVGHDPSLAASSAYWSPLGADNAWAMFDLLRNTQTTLPVDIVVTLTPGQRVNAIALLGLVATSVTIVMTSSTGGGTVYNKTINLNQRECYNWYDYFFALFSTAPSLIQIDLPPYSDCVITVTITNNGGNRSCGSCVVGNDVDLGTTQYNAQADCRNYSTVTRDAFGNTTLVPRRNIPLTVQDILCNPAYLGKVLDAREALNAAPAVWSGIDDNTNGYFNPLLILGFYTRFLITATDVNFADITLDLEEV